LLYGIGNKELLKNQSIGFVGSRDTNSDDDAFTQALAQQVVDQGFTVISGGAKGVDQTSMIAALDAGGSAIGILADSLLKTATKPQYRAAIQDGRLLLVTPYYPEAGFNTGNAMGRNKYIYSLSKGVVVAKSAEKGGTWSGATENLKQQWVPLWVRDIEQTGNQKLIELGGHALSADKFNFAELQVSFSFNSISSAKVKELKPEEEPQPDLSMGDLFCQPVVDVVKEPRLQQEPKPEQQTENQLTSDVVKQEVIEPTNQQSLGLFVDVFYEQLKEQVEKTHTPKSLVEKYPELSESLIKDWLKKLDEYGLLKRQGRKLAYKVIKNK
jgi:predicted Rossmann fold nucleotide-binding protein DprA/Smf involved in DNA uptake